MAHGKIGFEALEAEVSCAELEGRSIVICMDANSKLGPAYIKGNIGPTCTYCA